MIVKRSQGLLPLNRREFSSSVMPLILSADSAKFMNNRWLN